MIMRGHVRTRSCWCRALAFTPKKVKQRKQEKVDLLVKQQVESQYATGGLWGMEKCAREYMWDDRATSTVLCALAMDHSTLSFFSFD